MIEFAKINFRGFKETYKTQIDEKKATDRKRNERNNRWLARRTQACHLWLLFIETGLTLLKKLDRMMSAIPQYIDVHKIDPTVCLCQDHMSDEASGPEDEAIESKDEWKMRMAVAYGMKDPTPGVISKMKFLEKIRPEWRSEQVRIWIFLTNET